MSTVTQGNFITAAVGADLRNKNYYIVKLNSTRKAELATAGTDEISGVLDEVPQGTTGSCSIKHISSNGTGKVVASAAISKGAYLTATTGGKAVNTTTSGHRIFGRALEAAAADGDVIEFEHMFFIY